MVWCFLLANMTVILAAAHLRYAGEGMQYAAPVSMPSQLWWGVTGACAAGAMAAGALCRRRLRDRAARRSLIELWLVFPLFFAFEWSMLPPYLRQFRWFHWVVLAAFVSAIVVMFILDRRNSAQWGVTGRNFVRAVKLLAAPTAVMVAAPIIAALLVGTDFGPGRAMQSLGYPAYALAQLVVFQSFLVTRLRRISTSTAAVVIAAAGTFALAHWPNGLLMAGCFAGGIVWTLVFLRRPNVYALAISMGLAAAAFANALPREGLTKNMRTGPIYVQRMIERHGE
jgi:hypothetical protein